jgi:hypothetical protein
MNYKQIKEKISLPIIYTKLTLIYLLAYIFKASPKYNKEKLRIRFTTDKVKTIFIFLLPTAFFSLILIGSIIQIFGKFWCIWLWVLIYLCFSFDFIWLNEEEEQIIFKNFKNIITEEEKEEETNIKKK